DTAGARKSFDERLSIDRKAAEANPSSLRVQLRISNSLFQIGRMQLAARDTAGARKSYGDAAAADMAAAEIARAAYVNNATKASKEDVVNAFGHVSWSSSLIGDPARAKNYAEVILKVDPSQAWIQINLAHAYMLLGRHDEAKPMYLEIF